VALSSVEGGDLQGRALRIAHMGYVNAPMAFGMLGAIEMALETVHPVDNKANLKMAGFHASAASTACSVWGDSTPPR